MKRTMLPVVLATTVLLWAGGSGCGRREPEPAPPPTTRERLQQALPPPPAPRRLPLVFDEKDLPAQFSTVWWTLAPTGATLRISGPQGEVVSTCATERVAVPLRTDFYVVEVSHPGYEPFVRRMSLGGSATNQTITLDPLPPTEAVPEVAAVPEVEASPSPPVPARPPKRALTLATLEGATPPATPPKPTPQPTAKPPKPAEASAPLPEDPSLRRTERVRIRVVSASPNDAFLPQAIKHLHIGRRDLVPMQGLALELPYEEVGGNPLVLRIQHYEVQPASAQVTPHAPDGVCDVAFRAVPHPVSASFAEAPEGAEVWLVESGRPSRRIAPASRVLWLEPFRENVFEIRAKGFQPATVTLQTPEPAVALPATTVRCLPLPLTARPGQTCRIDLGNGVDLVLAWVPGGRVVLADPRFVGSPPDVRVETLPRSFWMAQTEITRAQWSAVMPGSGPEAPADGGLPKTGVSWDEAARFAQNVATALRRGTVRLPTEAEWEHAAFGGTEEAQGGIGPSAVRHAANSKDRPAPALSGPGNPWRLHHLCGNVREWCADPYATYRSGPDSPSARRVVRGGGYRNGLGDCAANVRDSEPPQARLPDLGFRIVLFPDRP